MMPLELLGVRPMATSCAVCVFKVLRSCMLPLVHILPLQQSMSRLRVQKVARDEGPGCLQLKEQVSIGA